MNPLGASQYSARTAQFAKAGVIVAGVIGVGGVTGIIGWGHVGSHDEEPLSVRDTPTHDVRPVLQMTPTYSDLFQPR